MPAHGSVGHSRDASRDRLADRHPERALAWVVESINGRVDPDGLSIPLLGTNQDAIQLQVKTTEDATW